MEKLFKIGLIVKPQGIKGEFKVQPLTDDITRFSNLKDVLIDDKNYRVTTLFYNALTNIASEGTNIPLRNNGRPRRRLPIACAAPGPCSALSTVPHRTNRGSLNGF